MRMDVYCNKQFEFVQTSNQHYWCAQKGMLLVLVWVLFSLQYA